MLVNLFKFLIYRVKIGILIKKNKMLQKKNFNFAIITFYKIDIKNTFIMKFWLLFTFFPFYLILNSQSVYQTKNQKKLSKKISNWENSFSDYSKYGNTKIDSFSINDTSKNIKIFFNQGLSNAPIREETIENAKNSFKKHIGHKFKKFNLQFQIKNDDIIVFVPNFFRKNYQIDSSRFPQVQRSRKSIVNRSYKLPPVSGLLNYNLAIWHSHGRYYDAKQDRWEWQRAKLHSTVEDLLPMSYVIDYLAPMLENAGANVFIPRERDINTNEIIIDNDGSSGTSEVQLPSFFKIDTLQYGFKMKDTIFNFENPFALGTYLRINPVSSKTASVKYIPEIPESGSYAVYISWGPSESTLVNCTVNYSGGFKVFKIDQTMGAGTWIFLDYFYFEKGKNPENGSVVFSGLKSFTIDAIRLGGGMGNIARKPSSESMPNVWSLSGARQGFQNDTIAKINPDEFKWKISNLPRYTEGARYFLQYSGIPDTLVFSLSKGKNDYNDDYMARPQWVNYLNGNEKYPFSKDYIGLNIPIDAALAFHTDAGKALGDTIIGTLAIYSSDKPKTQFPNGQSKMASRDLADIIQTEIVADVSENIATDWNRRAIWNRPYNEAWRPNVPTMLLELLSHQNLNDIQYALDPRFKFIVSRAIYKGFLKYFAFQEKREYIVQPLPVEGFNISIIDKKNRLIRLNWKSKEDKNEPTSQPKAFIIYTREEGKGFDQGIMSNDTFIELKITEFNKIFSFKITAINQGGESFPSEILSVGLTDKSDKTALIINAFDRICSPTVIKEDHFSGFSLWKDMGVPDRHDPSFIGYPYDFDYKNPWTDDDSPGWGACYSDYEGKVVAGNNHDYTFTHGISILKSAYNFTSTSDEYFESQSFLPVQYQFVDFIYGEEKTSIPSIGFKNDDFRVFNDSMKNKIKKLTENNINILITGAYIGSDFSINNDTVTKKFASEVLHYKWRTNMASKTGIIKNTDSVKDFFNGEFHFNTELNEHIYTVESPDGIEPEGSDSYTCFRYCDSSVSAGIAYKSKYKVVALGFPFETLKNENEQDNLMKQIINFFDN